MVELGFWKDGSQNGGTATDIISGPLKVVLEGGEGRGREGRWGGAESIAVFCACLLLQGF